MLRVQPRRRHHIDEVDLGVVREPVHRGVIVDVLFGKAVVRRPFLALGPRAGDHAGQTYKLGLFQSRPELFIRVVPKTDEREPELLRLRGRAAQAQAWERNRRRPEGKAADKGATRKRGELGSFHRVEPTKPSFPPKQAATIHLVPGAGLEPARPFGQGILSPMRLPFRHPGGCAAREQNASPRGSKFICESVSLLPHPRFAPYRALPAD